MHTVFINTSRAQFSDRMDVLWMEREYKQYIAIDSPLSAACGARQGFASCALRIGEQIDIHKDINNDFNVDEYKKVRWHCSGRSVDCANDVN